MIHLPEYEHSFKDKSKTYKEGVYIIAATGSFYDYHDGEKFTKQYLNESKTNLILSPELLSASSVF